MTNDEPISYVIPAFPLTVRLVRVFSNFTAPNLKNKMQSDIRELLKKHTGHLYLLTNKGKIDLDKKVLGAYGLRVGNGEGKTIISRLDQDLALYRLDSVQK